MDQIESLIDKKLRIMARNDGLSQEAFLSYAAEVCRTILLHSPSGKFRVILPTGVPWPLSTEIGTGIYRCVEPEKDPRFRDKLVELMYRLRDCAAGASEIKMESHSVSFPTTLQIRKIADTVTTVDA